MQPIELLWIDDEIDLLEAHILFLSQKGYNITKAHSGQDAIALLKDTNFNIVLLDENMPGMSGIEVLSEIKGAADLKNLPVIVFSNRDGQEDRKRAVQLGANAFYVKAMTDLAELIEQIETVTKLR